MMVSEYVNQEELLHKVFSHCLCGLKVWGKFATFLHASYMNVTYMNVTCREDNIRGIQKVRP